MPSMLELIEGAVKENGRATCGFRMNGPRKRRQKPEVESPRRRNQVVRMNTSGLTRAPTGTTSITKTVRHSKVTLKSSDEQAELRWAMRPVETRSEMFSVVEGGAGLGSNAAWTCVPGANW